MLIFCSSHDYDEVVNAKPSDESIETVMRSKDPNHFKFSMFSLRTVHINSLLAFQSEKTTATSKASGKKRTEFYCTCYYAKQFAALRKAYM